MENRKNILLTGPARSGTNLACSLLNKLDNVVALQESMQVAKFVKLKNIRQIRNQINVFFSNMRTSALERGEVISNQLNGNILDNYFQSPGETQNLRHDYAERGAYVKLGRTVNSNVTLILKHPAAFTALLPELIKHFPVFAIIRHPLWVLASWNSLSIAHYSGHAPIAEQLDHKLAMELEHTPDRIDRQIHLLSWMFNRYKKLDQKHIIFYEKMIETSGKALKAIVPDAQNLSEHLKSQNRKDRYPNVPIENLHKRLLKKGGPFFDFYSAEKMDFGGVS